MTALACSPKLLQFPLSPPAGSEALTNSLVPTSCLVNSRTPSCSQTLRLQDCLEQFRRDARWTSCDTGRYQCEYVSWGTGPTLAFIPGLCDDPWTFILPMARLSGHFRCIAYSMPVGNGDGSRLGGYRHEHLVEDLFAVLDHAGSREAFLLGNSFGATIAIAALHARPERFPRAVLQGGFACRPLAWTELMIAAWARWWPGTLDY